MLCDKIDLTCCDPQTVYGPRNYFKIDILDSNYFKKDGDGVELTVSQKIQIIFVLRFNSKVEPTSLIKIDKDVTGTDKAKKI